jgi:hypothetical protein
MDGEAIPDFRGHFRAEDISQRFLVAIGDRDASRRRLNSAIPW